MYLADAERLLAKEFLPHIVKSLEMLGEEDIWWRPNEASNSAGNLVLHLSGNVRQWIVSGLGGAADVRKRDWEFAQRGPVPRRELLARLRKTVAEARRVLRKLTATDLKRKHTIQGFQVTGLEAVSHVYEHFSHHAGQIVYITKTRKAKDLRFTKLPAIEKKK